MIGSIATSILSMLATLAIAYGIDRWVYYQRRIASQMGDGTRYEAWIIVGGLVLLLVWILFSWLILTRMRRIPAVSIIYIIIGLLAFLWFPLQGVSPFWMTHLFLFPTYIYNTQFSGLYIAVLGCLSLIIQKGNPIRA